MEGSSLAFDQFVETRVAVSSGKAFLKMTFAIDLHVVGKNWDEANARAEELLKQDEGAFFVHPFNQPSTWQGHSTLIDELKEQMAEQGFDHPPACVVSCAGGGGLAIGLLQGIERSGWRDATPLVVMETEGSKNFHLSTKTGKRVVLDDIKTIATSLGARAVDQQLLDLAKERPVVSRVVTDQDALKACYKFSKDHRMLVEPACGAALSAAYKFEELNLASEIGNEGPIVMVVCGGCMASMDIFEEWRAQIGLNDSDMYSMS